MLLHCALSPHNRLSLAAEGVIIILRMYLVFITLSGSVVMDSSLPSVPQVGLSDQFRPRDLLH